MLNRDNHNILIVDLKSGNKLTYSFPFSTQKEEALGQILNLKEFEEDSIKKVYWLNETDQGLAVFGDYYDTENDDLNLKLHALEQKVEQVRMSRNSILQKLHIEMIKLLEQEDCIDCKKNLTKVKKFLRDVPELILNQEFKRIKDIHNFNPYDNVFNIHIEDAGSGYTSPPTIEIEPPNGHPLKKGFQMEAQALINDGGVSEVVVTKVGSSYISRPKVTVSAPDEEDGIQAVLFAELPQNNVNLPPLTEE